MNRGGSWGGAKKKGQARPGPGDDFKYFNTFTHMGGGGKGEGRRKSKGAGGKRLRTRVGRRKSATNPR